MVAALMTSLAFKTALSALAVLFILECQTHKLAAFIVMNGTSVSLCTSACSIKQCLSQQTIKEQSHGCMKPVGTGQQTIDFEL